MNYQELKSFALQLNVERAEIPLNSLRFAERLNISYGNEDDAKSDFKGQINPLYEVPAFLRINKITGERKIYYNSRTRFWSFYLMHEIAHYLLWHKKKSYQNEIEADMLACILLVPPEIVEERAENSYEVYKLCGIPIDKADMYWQEIFDERWKRNGE